MILTCCHSFTLFWTLFSCLHHFLVMVFDLVITVSCMSSPHLHSYLSSHVSVHPCRVSSVYTCVLSSCLDLPLDLLKIAFSLHLHVRIWSSTQHEWQNARPKKWLVACSCVFFFFWCFPVFCVFFGTFWFFPITMDFPAVRLMCLE